MKSSSLNLMLSLTAIAICVTGASYAQNVTVKSNIYTQSIMHEKIQNIQDYASTTTNEYVEELDLQQRCEGTGTLYAPQSPSPKDVNNCVDLATSDESDDLLNTVDGNTATNTAHENILDKIDSVTHKYKNKFATGKNFWKNFWSKQLGDTWYIFVQNLYTSIIGGSEPRISTVEVSSFLPPTCSGETFALCPFGTTVSGIGHEFVDEGSCGCSNENRRQVSITRDKKRLHIARAKSSCGKIKLHVVCTSAWTVPKSSP